MASSTLTRPMDIVIKSMECYNMLVIDRGCNLHVPTSFIDRDLTVDIGGNVNMTATTINFNNSTIDFCGATINNFTGNINGNISVSGNLVAETVFSNIYIGGTFVGDKVTAGCITSDLFVGPLTGDVCGDLTTSMITEKVPSGGIIVDGTMTGDFDGTFTGNTTGYHFGTSDGTFIGSLTGTGTGSFFGDFCGNVFTNTIMPKTIGGDISLFGNLILEDGSLVFGDTCISTLSVANINSKTPGAPINIDANIIVDNIVTNDLFVGGLLTVITFATSTIIAPVGCFSSLKADTISENSGFGINFLDEVNFTTNVQGANIGASRLISDFVCGNVIAVGTLQAKSSDITVLSDIDAAGQTITASTVCSDTVQVLTIEPKTGGTVTVTGNLDVMGSFSPESISANVVKANVLMEATPGQGICISNNIDAKGNIFAAGTISAPTIGGQNITATNKLTTFDLCVTGAADFQGNIIFTDLEVTGNTLLMDTMINGDLIVTDKLTVANLCVLDDLDIVDKLTVGDLCVAGNAIITQTLTVSDLIVLDDLQIVDKLTTEDLCVNGDATFFGNLTAGNLNLLDTKLTLEDLCVTGDATFFGNVMVGNIDFSQSGKITIHGLCVIGETDLFGNLDMQCNNIGNVNELYVEDIFGKSPINVHDTLYLRTTGDGGNIWFEGGIAIGDPDVVATNSTDVAVGKDTDATGGNSVALGQGAQATGARAVAMGFTATASSTAAVAIGDVATANESAVAVGDGASATGTSAIAVGNGATASQTDEVRIGDPTPTSSTAVARVWNQIFQNRAWADATTQLAAIDGTGNIVKGATDDLLMTANIDMDCFNITNVNELHVEDIFGKSPVNVHDTLYLRTTGDGGNVWFEGGVAIGNPATMATSTGVSVGKSAITTGSNSVAVGSSAEAAATGIAVGFSSYVKSTAANGIAIGNAARCYDNVPGFTNSTNTIAIGTSARAKGASSISIGNGATGGNSYGGANGISIGTGAAGQGNDSIAIGSSATAAGSLLLVDGIAIGHDAYCFGRGIAVGSNSSAGPSGCIFGHNAITLGQAQTAIGHGAMCTYTGGFNQNVAVGHSATTTGLWAVSLGASSTASAAGSIAVGYAVASSSNSVAIGHTALASGVDDIRIGDPTPASGVATARAWNQIFQDRAWVDGLTKIAGIDGTGNIIKGPSADLTLTGNIDMDCFNITNVNELYVEDVFGKSPINVHDTLYLRTIGDGGNIWFEGGIEIGSSTTSSFVSTDVVIGKGANTTHVSGGSIAVGNGSNCSSFNATAVGNNASAGRNGTAIGFNSITTGISNTALGQTCKAYGNSSISVGTNCTANQNQALVIGASSSTTGSGAITLGFYSNNSGTRSTVIGWSSDCAFGNYDCVLIGSDVTNSGSRNIAIGRLASATSNNAIALGYNSIASSSAVAIGNGATANASDEIRIGDPTPASSTATARVWNQIFQQRSWADSTTTKLATIDHTGNILKGADVETTYDITGNLTVSANLDVEKINVVNLCVTGNVIGIDIGFVELATGNLDMACFNIDNVNELYVEDLFGKSPINVHDTVYLRTTGDGGNIWFEGGIEIGDSTTSTDGVVNAIAIGKGAAASGSTSVAIGDNSVTAAANAIAIGSATSSGTNGIAIGNNSIVSASTTGGVALGLSTDANANHAVAIGSNAQATTTYSIAIGGGTSDANAANATFTQAIAIGRNSLASTQASIAIGAGAQSTTTRFNIAIGNGAISSGGGTNGPTISIGNGTASGYYGIAIGNGTTASGNWSIAMGQSAVGGSTTSLAIGFQANAPGLSGVAIGRIAGALGVSSVAIGYLAKAELDSVTIGRWASGSGATSGSTVSVAIGSEALRFQEGSRNVAVGRRAGWLTTTGADNTFIGSNSGDTNTVGSRNICVGTNSDVTTISTSDGIAIGNGASAGNIGIAIGLGTIATEIDEVRIGDPTPTSSTAVARVWNQVFQQRSWADATTKLAAIDGTGNIVKGPTDDLTMTGNLDMACFDITNVNELYVEDLFGKSPINVHDTLYLRTTGDGGNIWFDGGIEIGDSVSSAFAATDVVVGKSATTTHVSGLSTAVGNAATCTGQLATAIGSSTSAAREGCAVGNGCSTTGRNHTAIGKSCSAGTVAHQQSLAIGFSCTAAENTALAIGGSSSCTGSGGMTIGWSCTNSGIRSIVMGWSSDCAFLDNDCVIIGTDVTNTGDRNIAIGRYADTTANDSIALGCNSEAAAAAVAIGLGATADATDEIRIGNASPSSGTATARAWNQVFQDLSWNDATTKIAVIDITGNITKGTTNDLTITGNLTIGSDSSDVLTVPAKLDSTGIGGCTPMSYVPMYFDAAIENIAAGVGGAISITTTTTQVETDGGGDSFTLADGSMMGQIKIIHFTVDGGGDATITPTTLASFTTITMNTAGQTVQLLWGSSGWRVIFASVAVVLA